MKRCLLVASVLAIGFWWAAPAHAAAGGAMTAANGVFTGTSGDDVLIIGRSADVLTNNRFAAGDPGFASETDFDSTVEGVQTKTFVPFAIGFNAGDGNDVLRVVGLTDLPLGASDFGPGSDTIDFAQAGGGVDFTQSSPVMDYPTLETIVGSPFDDILGASGSSSTHGVHILGGAGNDRLAGTPYDDTLDGGDGVSSLFGFDGNDTLIGNGPGASAIYPGGSGAGARGGNGNDTWIINGTPGQDAWIVSGKVSEFTPTSVEQQGAPDGAQLSDAEAIVVEGDEGADEFKVEAVAKSLTLHGGPGTDSVVVDARTGTAAFANTNGVRTLGLFQGTTRAAAIVIVDANVENASILNESLIVTAPNAGGGPHVRTFRANGMLYSEFFAYPDSFMGGVNVAVGDVDGDGIDDVITGAGPGGGPHVRVFASNGSPLGPNAGAGFFAYDATYSGGVDVAAIDIDGDGSKEIVTANQTGPSQPVRMWSLSGALLSSFQPAALGEHVRGIHVAAGQIDVAETGSKRELIMMSPRQGFGAPVVVRPNGDLIRGTQPPYGNAWTSGAAAARADVNGPFTHVNSQYLGIATGAGPGGGPHVRVITPTNDIGKPDPVVGSFYAYDVGFGGGVDVATCNPDGNEDDIATAPGSGGGPHVRLFTKTGVAKSFSIMAYDSAFLGGVTVSCGGGAVRTQV